jgi:hypothetical protein
MVKTMNRGQLCVFASAPKPRERSPEAREPESPPVEGILRRPLLRVTEEMDQSVRTNTLKHACLQTNGHIHSISQAASA